MFLSTKNSLGLSLNRIRREINLPNFRNFHLTYFVSSKREVTEYHRCEDDPTVASKISIDPPRKVDNNFYGVESDEGVTEVVSKTTLKNSGNKRVFVDSSKDRIIPTRFGSIRYDAHNKPTVNKRIEKSNVQHISDAEEGKIFTAAHRQSLYTKNSNENFEVSPEHLKESRSVHINEDIKSESFRTNYIDQLYFSEQYVEKDNIDHNLEHSPSAAVNDQSNFIDECYFNNEITEGNISKKVKTENKNINMIEKHSTSEKNASTIISDKEKYSLFDENYFSNDFSKHKPEFVGEDNQDSIGLNNKTEGKDVKYFGNQENLSEVSEKDKVNVFEENYFIEKLTNDANLMVEKKIVEDATLESPEQSFIKIKNLELEKLFKSNEFSSVTAKKVPEMKNKFLFHNSKFLNIDSEKNTKDASKMMKSEMIQSKHLEEKDDHIERENLKLHKNIDSYQDRKSQKEQTDHEKSETAYDFVKKLRSAKKESNPELINGKFMPKMEKLDSKGFKIMKNQVPNLMHYTRDEILDVLVKNVLYSDDDLVVLNKPYNLVIHDSKTVKDACLSQYLDDLASELDKQTNKPKLLTVHRLDKETTGCLLLARNETSAHNLKSLFAQRKITKTYWIVTIKVPDPLEGVIDIPISEGSIQGRTRMVLHPDLPKDIPYKNHSSHGKRAVSHYKVVAQSGNAALVEVKPETGLKHQIRVHFGFGLSCPILGDHKYSYLDKLVPQKLQADLLQKLHVRQSKVRHIPMHIYARSILIPQYKDGRHLFVMAPMPLHMSKNLQKLKFKKNK